MQWASEVDSYGNDSGGYRELSARFLHATKKMRGSYGKFLFSPEVLTPTRFMHSCITGLAAYSLSV